MKISIYIHIPFCVRKCLYCDFLSFSATEEVYETYVNSLVKEIIYRSVDYFEYEVESIFFGGGTPSILPAGHISKILEAIYTHYDVSPSCETTIEINPGTISENDGKLDEYAKAGINRLSIGLQSANDEELRLLGRIHKVTDFEKLWEMVHRKGFNNCNVDIMSAINNQTTESYKNTLEYVCNLDPKPTHISAYSLIIEENTPYATMKLNLPNEDDERYMYVMTKQILSQYGYNRYEISNYALDGYECYHNKVYWNRGNYVGLGLGASSMVENVRWKNTPYLQNYIDEEFIHFEDEVLSIKSQMEEYMFLGLRMSKGVTVAEFEEYFGCEFPKEYWEVVQKYKKLGLIMVYDNNRIMLTDEGVNVSNVVLSEFLFD